MNFQQNFMNSLTGGLQFGQQLKAQRDTTQINRLAGQAYNADPEQRESLLAQMQQVNPTMAAEQEKALGMTDERRQKGLINAARILVNTPEQFRAGQYARMVPGLSRYGLSDLPPEYNAETSGLIMETAQGLVRAADGAGTQPTQFAALDLQAKAAGYQPGTQGYQDFFKRANGELARQSGAAIQYKEVEIDGRKVLVAVDPREIGAQVVGGGPAYGSYAGQQAQVAAPAVAPERADMEADIELANSMIAAGIPEAQVDAFLAQRGQRAPAPSATQGAATPAGGVTIAGNPFVSRTPEEQAALTEQARADVQLRNLPTELNMRGQAAVDQAVGIEQGKAGVERDQMAATRQRDAGTALELLGEAERLLPQATGGRIGAAGDAVAGAFGVSTDGARANAALATIAGQLTSKMPRMEGPQSDRDVQMYKEMAGDLANANLPTETRLAALQQIRRLQSKYAGGQRQQPRQPPVMVNSPAEYNALPAGALYTAPDGSTRRKK